jgi:hypothetical protein
MGVHFDTSQVDRLAADLSRAPGRIQRKAPGVMKKGALEILRAARKEFSGHSHAPHAARSFEMRQWDSLGLSWEVGELDSSGPQWGIPHILQYGTSNNAPVADIKVALRGEIPAIMRHLGDTAEDSVLGGSE